MFDLSSGPPPSKYGVGAKMRCQTDCHCKIINIGEGIKSNGPEPTKIAMPTLLLFETEMAEMVDIVRIAKTRQLPFLLVESM